MPQAQLPIFPVGTTIITPELGFERRDKQVVYYSGHMVVFTHEVDDLASFRLFTTQLIVNGTASPRHIVKAFGVSATTVKRSCRLYRERGVQGFFKPAARRQGNRLTAERLVEVQGMLDEGQSVPEISRKTGMLPTTLHKAIDQNRLQQKKGSAERGSGARDGRFNAEPAERRRPAGSLGCRHDALGGALVGFHGSAARSADPF